MDGNELLKILKAVEAGESTAEDAFSGIRLDQNRDLGFANVDLGRSVRTGRGEVVFGGGKTPDQIVDIVCALRQDGQKRVLITRLDEEKALTVKDRVPEFQYFPGGRIAVSGSFPEPDGKGYILIMTAGTSDIYVAEEAAVTARAMGNDVRTVYDVGVAGIHRLLSHSDEIGNASVIIAIAGMEGAFPAVVTGLASCPVIAVPTSVGYGTAFGGLTALMSMLNSCASGMCVENIDNGFGAAVFASLVNH
ncbi:MAG: nickel pincer cofactor biosynthesis protein LarB [Lachnospiraceae bacterium]|nr:nickel pincer cofactor biosynthesis protein LarB [Lachnospiraceae bacterium]